MRSKSYTKGIWAEYLAALLLSIKGYRVLKLRHKTKVGEIDLIAKKAGVLVFVEVKTRKNYGDAVEAVTHKNQERVMRAAQIYLQKNPQYQNCEIRFDVVLWSSYARLSHIKAAWLA